jgi:hypothetical protein
MGLFLLGTGIVMLASDSILMLSAWADRWLSFLGCLALIALVGASRGAVFLGAPLAWMACRPDDPIVRTVLVAWVLALIGLAGIRRPGPAAPPTLGCLHLASLQYALALALYRRSALGWDISDSLSRAPVVPGAPPGVWTYGLPVYLFGVLILISAALLGRARLRHDVRRRLAGLAVLLAGCLLSAAVVRLGVPTIHLVVPWTHAAALGVVAAAAASAVPPRSSWMPRSSWRPRISVGITLAAVALAVWPVAEGSGGGAAGAGDATARDESSITFALYPAGLLDWRVPDAEMVGLVNSGMFGLFRRSLERCAAGTGAGGTRDAGSVAAGTGGRVIVLEKDPGGATGPGATPAITARQLHGVDATVFINPTVVPGPDEVECLKAYVESGGGLLVLGDHTDIGGSREPLNAVLSFTGIRFNFDSAIPLRRHWRGCLEVRPHPVTRRLGRAPGSELRAQLAVGASLAISGAARPLIIGRYGFADRGDSLNVGAGAFLGNAIRDRDERVGDVVLVAGQEIGKGRVLVFGDTSPFQNGALLLSQDLVSDAVSWVCGRSDEGRRLALAPYETTAGLDFSLHPRAGVSLFTDGSLGGLANCLARRHVTAVPVFSRDRWENAGGRSLEYLFVVGPTRMSARDAEHLLSYMNAGGNLILCQGHADPQPCDRLLEPLGLAITDIPLGDGGAACCISHKDAWALSWSAPVVGDTTVMASAFGYPTVIVMRFGRGSLTLVGDSRFLLDENLEGERTANKRNIAFLDSLLDCLSTGRDRRDSEDARLHPESEAEIATARARAAG